MPTILLNTEIMIFALLGIVLILTIWILILENRLKKFFRGGKGENIEEVIATVGKEIASLKTFQGESIGYLKNIESRLKRSTQAVETIRFNPFKGSGDGGNQSFATAMLNEKGEGVIISSLYTRDRVSVFSKPIKKFTSEFELTIEEKNALKNAKDSLAYQTTKE